MKTSWLIAGLIVLAGAVFVLLAFLYILPLDLRDHSPVQPIAFSHKVHAGDNGIPCLFCHRLAPDSPVAGIPAVADCRACHLFISSDAPEIVKLTAYCRRLPLLPRILARVSEGRAKKVEGVSPGTRRGATGAS